MSVGKSGAGMISSAFLSEAANILADTQDGLSGTKIAELCAALAVDFEVDIPFPTYPFPPTVANKHTALYKNLEAFLPDQRYSVLMDLCRHPKLEENQKVRKLKAAIFTRYRHLAKHPDGQELNLDLVEETHHWLSPHVAAHKVFSEALSKYKSNVLQRNLLDDFRLSLELLCKELLGNDKSLENQSGVLGDYIKDHGGSKEVRNMFQKVLDYYTKYQNEYVKHDDAVIEPEIAFVVELTCSLMKYLLQIENGKGSEGAHA
jgi:hypothetical protein